MNGNSSPVSAESIKAKLKNEADSCAKDFNYLLFHYKFLDLGSGFCGVRFF
jgi:hypothetical protein